MWWISRKGELLVIDWHDIEDLGFEAEQLASMAQAIDDAIMYGPSSAVAHQGALSLMIALMNQHAEKLQSIVGIELKGLGGSVK